ncbi:MAG: TetR/AcrR family transcriptional regulator C-terminal domain-containing protein [Firmicutes bacterium]|nr:TetR/AcrR family transcriptional regulator C-terminal domain-containing protein [Bacillota bacterium]
MNKKGNRQTQETDEKIVRAVTGMMAREHIPISKITVSEICSRCGIHRSTFYAHYLDIYDVAEKVEKTMAEKLGETIRDKIQEGAGARECFLTSLDFIREYREFYLLYFEQMRYSEVINTSWDLLREKWSEEENYGFSSMKMVEYHGAFMLHGMTSFILLWLEKGCEETPEELLGYLLEISEALYKIKEW